MRVSTYAVVCSLLFCVIPVTRSAAQTYAEKIVGGFTSPMFASYAPDDANRLFVARIWNGEIRIVNLTTRTVLPEPFLVIDDMPNPLRSIEQGLLGLTFDPEYAANGYFYVHFTGQDNSINVRRYRTLGDPATSNVADPDSGHTIINVPKSTWWHNAGWIDFGPNDGFLYINIGSPGAADGQDIVDNLHGKVLRIDVRGDDFPDDPIRNYSIPPSNPFVGREGDDEIWAYGLRNPFRASFDRLSGDLWINDTGENTREEVNYQPASSPGGENYAWPRREGSIEGPGSHGGPLLPEYTDPVYDYDHNEADPLFQGNVIAASGFYRGPVAAFYGHYFFTDNGSRNIWKLDPDAVDRRASVTNVKHLLLPNSGAINRMPAFGEDAIGNLYIMDYDAASQGEVFRIATASKDIVWDGDDGETGVAGNGTDWADAMNWSRDGVADAAFVEEDHVIFAAGSSQSIVDLNVDRTLAALTFGAPYRLQNHVLKVLSGNVLVEEGVTATVDSTLVAETVNHSIRKLGPGTLVVNGDAGQTAVKEGTLAGHGTFDHLSVRSGTTVAPGSGVGILTVDQSFVMEQGATLSVEIGGNDNSDPQNPEFDQLMAGGEAKLDGTLAVTLVDIGGGIFSPGLGNSFPIVSSSEGLSGAFDTLDVPALPTGLVWKTSSDDNTLFLNVAARLAGDYNGNGIVDAADYVVWRKTVGQTGGSLVADGSGPLGTPDGVVDNLDYNFWRTQFGAASSSAGQSTRVPEPATALSLMLGLLVGFIRQRRLKAELPAAGNAGPSLEESLSRRQDVTVFRAKSTR